MTAIECQLILYRLAYAVICLSQLISLIGVGSMFYSYKHNEKEIFNISALLVVICNVGSLLLLWQF